ncbi:hypothetical protein VTI28DRAFT_9591 [Corynascus sepedonium]
MAPNRRVYCLAFLTVSQYTTILPSTPYWAFFSSTNAATTSSSISARLSYRHTWYRTFLRVVGARNHWTAPGGMAGNPMIRPNSASSAGRNVAVKYTIWTSALTNPRNPNTRDRHVPPAPESNTVWHSSTTIRSNRPIARCRLMKCPKLSDTAASGVTNTIDAHS